MTTPSPSIRQAPWLIELATKWAARSPCQVMSVVTSWPIAWPTAVRWYQKQRRTLFSIGRPECGIHSVPSQRLAWVPRHGSSSGPTNSALANSGSASRSDHCFQPITAVRSEEHTSELQSRENLVCRLLLEKKKKKNKRDCTS